MSDYEARIVALARKQFIGRTIVDVSYADNASSEEMGWDGRRGVVFELDDGTQLIPMQDDEGNGPGALATSLGGELGLLAVLDN